MSESYQVIRKKFMLSINWSISIQ